MTDSIVCLYTCDDCGVTDAEVDVQIRSKAETVIDWMDRACLPALMADHEARSPQCRPLQFTSIKIPLPIGSRHLGRPVEH